MLTKIQTVVFGNAARRHRCAVHTTRVYWPSTGPSTRPVNTGVILDTRDSLCSRVIRIGHPCRRAIIDNEVSSCRRTGIARVTNTAVNTGDQNNTVQESCRRCVPSLNGISIGSVVFALPTAQCPSIWAADVSFNGNGIHQMASMCTPMGPQQSAPNNISIGLAVFAQLTSGRRA